MKLKHNNPTDRKGGSGSGPYIRGKRITRISQLRPGDILIGDSNQFDATNVVRVMELPKGYSSPGYGEDHVYTEFRDPGDIRRSRQGGTMLMCLWHWELKVNDYYKAVSEAAQGKLRVA